MTNEIEDLGFIKIEYNVFKDYLNNFNQSQIVISENIVNKLTANYIFLRGELDTNTPHVTSGHVQRFIELNKEWLIYKAELNAILEKDIKNFNEKCKALQLAHTSLID